MSQLQAGTVSQDAHWRHNTFTRVCDSLPCFPQEADVKELAQGHAARKWQGKGFESRLLTSPNHFLGEKEDAQHVGCELSSDAVAESFPPAAATAAALEPQEGPGGPGCAGLPGTPVGGAETLRGGPVISLSQSPWPGTEPGT